MKSEKFFDIEPPAPRKFTPSSTSMVCAHWLTLGPALEADDELARSGIERIHRDSPRTWVRTPGGGWLFAKLCRLPQDRRRTIRRCTLNLRATPLMVPTPCSYSRRICSNSSTFVLLSNRPPFWATTAQNSVASFCFQQGGQIRVSKWANSE